MKKVAIILVIIGFILSCSKDKEQDIEPTLSSQIDFTPMQVGNYWIYQHYFIDTSGNETALTRFDTVTITRQEIIGSKKYYVFEGTYYFTSPDKNRVLWKIRDSLGYLVDTSGMIQFAHNDFSDSLEVFCLIDRGDTVHCSAYQMQKKLHTISVPAGTFKALNCNRLVTVYPRWTNPKVKYPRDWDTFYANGIGKIQETYFYASQPDHYEIRLLKYHVQ